MELFKYEDKQVRTKLINDEVYFVGKDVADILGYNEPHKAIDRHVDEDDIVIDDISIPIEKILNKDGILYQLSTQACKDIMNDEYDYHQFATWEL